MRRNWGPIPNFPLVVNYQRKSNDFIKIAGPCSVETVEQIWLIAETISKLGVTHLRGGVFRAGTYPGKNFGLIDDKFLHAYHQAANFHGMENIIEVLDYTDRALTKASDYCTAFQVGARQMQNYKLLRILGSIGRPVFLKRNPGSTLDEWLGAAEHILTAQAEAGVNAEVFLIERGSSTNLNHVRWDLSISMIPAIKQISNIPVIVDASHGTGRRDLVHAMTLAGVAAGADGFLCEVHPEPKKSLSDSDQAIDFLEYANIVSNVGRIRDALY